MSIWVEDAPGEPPPAIGRRETAEIAVEVVEVDGEIDYFVTCLCAACEEVSNAGIPADLFEATVYGTPQPGVYYVTAWHEVHPGGPWGPPEYDGGLTISE